MAMQQFCLRWNNHQPNFISMFTTLLNTGSLVDVTLAAEGKHLQAHKVVLSACSVYFQTLFTANPSRHPIVILKDVTYADLRIMVDFMYYGEVNVSQDQLPQILETAKMLKIKGLTDMPDSASFTKSQSTSSCDLPAGESFESIRRSSSPPTPAKRRMYRKISTGSASTNDQRSCDKAYNGGLDTITLSSLPNRKRDYPEIDENGSLDTSRQLIDDDHNRASDPLDPETAGLPQGGQWSMMEYPRYTNPCGMPDQPNLYLNNNMDHLAMDLPPVDYGAMPGPSPGPSNLNEQPKRRRTNNPQAEEKFQRALEAVRFGGIGFCKAARMFGVNNRTLWLEYKKKGYPNNRPSIRSRVKRENASPDKSDQPNDQMAIVCQSNHSLPIVNYQQVDFSTMPTIPTNSLSLNFNNSMQ